MDYYVYGPSFDGCPIAAKGLAAAAVRQWGTVGKPDRYVAHINLSR